MNELIEKLSKEANAWYPKGYPSPEGGDEAWQNLVIFQKEELENYTKLIVQECAKIADEPSGWQPGYRIKRHFGLD